MCQILSTTVCKKPMQIRLHGVRKARRSISLEVNLMLISSPCVSYFRFFFRRMNLHVIHYADHDEKTFQSDLLRYYVQCHLGLAKQVLVIFAEHRKSLKSAQTDNLLQVDSSKGTCCQSRPGAHRGTGIFTVSISRECLSVFLVCLLYVLVFPSKYSLSAFLTNICRHTRVETL